jgi:hypothetical protein
VIPPANTLNPDVPGLLQLGQDAMNRTFGNADQVRQVLLTKVGISIQGKQDMTVVGQKRPGASLFRFGHDTRLPC